VTAFTTENLAARLANEAQPVKPLAPPLSRGLLALAAIALVGAALVLLYGDIDGLLARYAGQRLLMLSEMGFMLATALTAIVGAFHLAIPGRSRSWRLAPLPFLAGWIALSGLVCYDDIVRIGSDGWRRGHGADCLIFIVAASLLVGGPLMWRLSRARPIDPLPVALLGGLGAAASSALLLQFFHPFALTAADLVIHMAAAAIAVALAALSRRQVLAPA
jgi:hypothetical protein